MKILVLNSGSSSQKSSLFEIGADAPPDPPQPLWEGTIEWNAGELEEVPEPEAAIHVRTSRGADVRHTTKASSRKRAIAQLLDTLWSGETRVISRPAEIDAVGHRVVHGGPHYRDPALITPEVKSAIAQFAFIAPLHNRAELAGMDLIEEHLDAVPQIAVFDTAFHSQMPEAAYVYPGPYDWVAQGIRRYGFHGINHQYCAERAAQLLQRELGSLRIVTCHLGNGCSLAAVRDARSIDTTMGFTPLEGLMMGTRSGSVDPGILTYLASTHGVSGQHMDEMLNTQSGLLGISGLSSDMREIEQAKAQGHTRAKLAFDIFVHRLQAGIGAMVVALGGIDALVFTAGIGEHSSAVRAAACANLGYLGLELDAAKNAHAAPDVDISAAGSRARVLVIHAQEDWAIARQCQRLIGSRRAAQKGQP